VPQPPELDVIARDFLLAMQACVRDVDFARARPLFDPDVVAFGTVARVVRGRDHLEANQWRHVWPTIRAFTFDLESLHCLGDEHGLCVVVAWDSLGVRADGSTFARPGRATLLLEPRDGRWVATHSHFSLVPTPPSPSTTG